ncbi:MAG: hypothetical protein ACYTEV_11950 [Planctomycetota bacterium]
MSGLVARDHAGGASNMTQLERRPDASDALAARNDAARLLEDLLRERAATEARLAEAGREDPIRMVTGRSALDRAIRSTQDVLARMDAMLLESGGPACGIAVTRSEPRGVRPPATTEGH